MIILLILICKLIPISDDNSNQQVYEYTDNDLEQEYITDDILSGNGLEEEILADETDNLPQYSTNTLGVNSLNTQQKVYNCLWEEIEDLPIQEGYNILKDKEITAKRIITQFPTLPHYNSWPCIPDNKGKYASKGERYCAEFLEILFPNYTFVKSKPSWLKNPKTNRRLELDCYCEELQIAVEYNGYQHYVWPNCYHKSKDAFYDQKKRDKIKELTCIQRGICLIRIPYTVDIEKIPLAIYCKLLEAIPHPI